MSKAYQFLKCEKDKYGKIFVAINYAIDNISPFLDKDILNRRKYVSKISTLKKYIDLIEAAQSELDTGNFFNRLKSDKYISILEDYKNDNLESLSQLEKCSTCQCLNCISECKFDSCLGCKNSSKIIHCDKRKINITKHDNFSLNLTNDKTGESDSYVVLAVLQDIELEKKYIIIQNIHSKDKFILYYYPGISEDSYGEISDAEEFDFIVSTFQSIEE